MEAEGWVCVGLAIVLWLCFMIPWWINRHRAFSNLGKTRIAELSNGKFQVQECRHASWDWEAIENPEWLPMALPDKQRADFDTFELALKFKQKVDTERSVAEPTVTRVLIQGD